MQILTLTQLNRALADTNFRSCLKYDRIGLIRRNKQIAHLLPVGEGVELEVLKSMSLSTFRQSIGFYADLLIEASNKQGNKSVAYALTDAGSERICYLAIPE